MKGLIRIIVLAHEPLRVSLADLHSADTRGKWWLVGAAWGGDPLAERAAVAVDMVQQPQHHKQENTDDALLRLARKQGMNTDVRRSVFVVLMSSDDYVDACERLAQLGLNEVQQREVVRVVLHCCGNVRPLPYFPALLLCLPISF
jgi:nucleolar MIF4G domain-containing protein 1